MNHTTHQIIQACVYVLCFFLVLFVSRGIDWSKIINPKHKVEGMIASIFVIVAVAFCVGAFINALIPGPSI